MAAPSAITDKKSIFPTNLNAKPIAKTATAIKIIVETPFLICDSFFGPDASSTAPDFLSSFFCFCFLESPEYLS